MATIRYLGEDIIISIEDGSAPLNMDAMAEIVVHLYTKISDIRKFSKTTRTGYTKLKRISATRYDIYLDSNMTKTMNPGTLMFGIRFFQVFSAMPDGYLDDIAVTSLLELQDSTLKTETAS